MAAATSVHVVAVIEPIIQHADWFFPEGERPAEADGTAFQGRDTSHPGHHRQGGTSRRCCASVW